jgi:hypothetical protein
MPKQWKMSNRQYVALFNKQDGKCAICGKEELKRSLSADHCHHTMIARELLCRKCNAGLGFFNDNLVLLEAATAYLRKHTQLSIIDQTLAYTLNTERLEALSVRLDRAAAKSVVSMKLSSIIDN